MRLPGNAPGCRRPMKRLMRAGTKAPPMSADRLPYQIPFNRTALAGAERDNIAAAIEAGQIVGNGEYGRRCERLLERLLGGDRRVMLTTSCTHALEMSALLLNLQPGEEVIMPSFTFVSTANAYALRGGVPRFVDIRPDTLNLDETKIEPLIGPHTRAIVAVHYGGVSCEMEAIEQIAFRHSLEVIEDNAHGLLGAYNGQLLGTLGRMATLSFHATKNFTCGEGGALIVNDRDLVDRAEVIREKGTDRARFFRGEVDKYTWVDLGSSYLMSEILAAFLLAQLEAHDRIQASRRRIWDRYDSALHDWAITNGVRVPTVPEHCDQAYHLYWIVLPEPEQRAHLIERLRALGIVAVFHYMPLNLSPMGRRLGGKDGDCPVTESVANRLLRLPFYNDLSESDQQAVIESILEFEP